MVNIPRSAISSRLQVALQNAARRLAEGVKGLQLPSDYPTVSEEEEAALIAIAVSDANCGIVQLFRVYGVSEPLKFLRFSRAIAERSKAGS